MASKSSFLDKVLGRIGRLDAEGLQTVVQRLARERSFLETLFNTIEDGVLVVDEQGRIIYFNQAVTRLLGLQADSRRPADHKFSARARMGKNPAVRRMPGASAWSATNLKFIIRVRAFFGFTPRRWMGKPAAVPAWR